MKLPRWLNYSEADSLAADRDLAHRERRRGSQSREAPLDASNAYAVTSACAHPRLNRYPNILAYERTRVVLPPKNPQQTDYINANWIHPPPVTDAPVPLRTWIAAQGPLDHTVGDFLSLFLDLPNPPSIVIMLTALFDGYHPKCARYVPESVGDTLEARRNGNDTICCTLLDSTAQENDLWCTNTLSIYRASDPSHQSHVTHIEFKAWPDHGLPASPHFVFLLHDYLMTLSPNPATDPPVLVHCSAGVGRTGTFIAVSSLLQSLPQIKSEWERGGQEADAVSLTITAMREQRVCQVESIQQVRFVRRAVQLAWSRLQQ